MPNSCSDPLVCTQETAAHLKRFRVSQLRCAPGYRHNDITVLIIGNPNRSIRSLFVVSSQCSPPIYQFKKQRILHASCKSNITNNSSVHNYLDYGMFWLEHSILSELLINEPSL